MKTVLVTGAARRIGAAIARALAADGWRVLVHARRADDPDARALACEIGGVALGADLAEPLGPARLFNAACAAAPEIEAVVNNAAVFSSAPALDSVAQAALEAVNVVAPEKLATMLAMRLMTNDERPAGLPRAGAVVNLLDCRVLTGGAPDTPYARSKARLLECQRRQALQFAPTLRVNAVAPGPVLAPAAGGTEKGGEILLAARPTPEDVARAVVYLLSAAATTDAVLPVDAGQAALARFEGRA